MPVSRELHNGERMTREEFHRAYENTKENFRAELIGGIVYVASPLKIGHGSNHLLLGSVLVAFGSMRPPCCERTTLN
jgi:Uma2 family endonuclease